MLYYCIMDETIVVNKFDLNSMVKNPTILLNAKRGSGKSVCIKHLLWYFGNVLHYPAGILCSKSESVDPFYQDFFPDSFIYDSCSDELFTKILRRQSKLIENNKKCIMNGEQTKDSRLIIVLDDVISDAKSWKNSEALGEIMFNGRHYDITFILAVQDVVAVGPAIRLNFDYVFLFKNDVKNEIDKIYKYYGGVFLNAKVFNGVVQKTTEDYGILVLIKRGEKSNALNDKIARFKADVNLKPSMFGCNKFKELHKRRYDTSWKEKQINNYGCKNKIKIL